MVSTYIFRMSLIVLLMYPVVLKAKALDGTAEHLMEVAMDFRYLSLPSANSQRSGPWSVQLGAAHINGHLLSNDLILSRIGYNWTLNHRWSINSSLFYDNLSFDVSTGEGIADMRFANVPQFPANQTINVTGGRGNGNHIGFSSTLVRSYDSGYAWQAGFISEDISVDKFILDFDSPNLTPTISGNINYAANYNIITPFFSFAFPHHILMGKWLGQFEMLLANPLTRMGFKGTISGENDVTGEAFSATSSTADVGKGKHIPDSYFGIKYMLLNPASGLIVDIGASLYSYIGEPKGHSGIDNPIFITLEWSF